MPRGWALLGLREVKPPRVPEFAEAEPQVRQAVTSAKAAEMTLAQGRAARAALDAGKPFAEVAQGLGVEPQESGEFGADGMIRGLGIQPALAAEALAGQQGGFGGPVAIAQGAVVYEISERKRFDPIAFAGERSALRESLAQQQFGRLLQSLIERRRAELTVNYNRQLLEQFDMLDQAASS